MSQSVEFDPEVFAAEQAEEWGQYRAVRAVYIDGVRAANPNDPFPASHPKLQKLLTDGVVVAVPPSGPED